MVAVFIGLAVALHGDEAEPASRVRGIVANCLRTKSAFLHLDAN